MPATHAACPLPVVYGTSMPTRPLPLLAYLLILPAQLAMYGLGYALNSRHFLWARPLMLLVRCARRHGGGAAGEPTPFPCLPLTTTTTA